MTHAPPPAAGVGVAADLREQLETIQGDRVTLGALVDLLGHRSAATLMLLFAAPQIVPLPPGTSSILGIPLVLASWQLLWAADRLWLPGWLRRRSLSRARAGALLDALARMERRFTRLIRPRLAAWTRGVVVRFAGLIGLILSTILWLPIPLGNIPPAFAITLFALGIIYGDGVFVAAGFAAATGALIVVGGVIWVAVQALLLFVRHALA